jgi:hypothetical protein
MEIQFEGIWLTLTPDQEKIVKRNRMETFRAKDSFIDVLCRHDFIRMDVPDTYHHSQYGWIAILDGSEVVCSVWMAGVGLRDDTYPGGHNYRSWKVLEKALVEGTRYCEENEKVSEVNRSKSPFIFCINKPGNHP